MTPAQQALIGKAETKIRAAIFGLLTTQPFYAGIIYRLRRQPDLSCDTMWVDGRTLGFSPSFVVNTSRDELVFVLAHEALHVAAMHHLRREDRDLKDWNVACDHVVNGIAGRAGLNVPPQYLTPMFDTTAEAIYAGKLKQRGKQGGQGQPQPDAQGAGGGPQGSGQQQGPPNPSQGKAGQQPASPNEQQQEGEGEGDGSPAEGSGQQPGEVRDMRNEDGTALSAPEKRQAEQETRVMVAQAERIAKRAGTMPGGLEQFVAAMLQPRVDWREVLARFLDERSRNDWTWMVPSRRYAGRGFVMPSLNAPAYGAVVFAGDTSASMGDSIKQVCSEVREMLRTYEQQGAVPDLWILWCDVRVHAQQVEGDAELPLIPVGFGGTSFAPVFKYIEDEDLDPRAVVYVTDGYCHDFGEEPNCPVLWIVTNNEPFHPPFGEVARLPGWPA